MTNLNKILYTCKQVNCRTYVENLSVKWGHFEYLLKSKQQQQNLETTKSLRKSL